MVCVVTTNFTSTRCTKDFYIVRAKDCFVLFNSIDVSFLLIIKYIFIYINIFKYIVVFTVRYFSNSILSVNHYLTPTFKVSLAEKCDGSVTPFSLISSVISILPSLLAVIVLIILFNILSCSLYFFLYTT